MSEVREIKCARCDCALEGPTNPKPQDRFSCPICGESDTHERILAEVGEYVKEQAAKAINKQMAQIASQSKFIKVTQSFKPKSTHRFVVDIKL